MDENQISRLEIAGFKSIKNASIDFGNINVFIGANGSGKSNLVSFFSMLQSIADGRLAHYVSSNGGLNAIFHYGVKTTRKIEVGCYFGNNGYGFELQAGQNGSAYFEKEWFYWNFPDNPDRRTFQLPSGQSESQWRIGTDTRIDKFVQPILDKQKWRKYHFHDTSETSSIKQLCAINDNIELAENASNIAAFLYRLRVSDEICYRNIVRTVRLIAPFFDDFILRPNPLDDSTIALEWKTQNRDTPFSASQLSDGTLRFICLACLLMQPYSLKPATIIIDEPELGLHPAAISVLAGLIRSASKRNQLILSTQSVELLDEFEPEDIIVVDRKDGASVFNRLSANELKSWIEDDYSMGDLWKKNVFGGRPGK
ncbi:MAG: AAA family ATPase [Clostridiales bacterium]|nr:AAA family ATPase [Clostridiales bacterium]